MTPSNQRNKSKIRISKSERSEGRGVGCRGENPSSFDTRHSTLFLLFGHLKCFEFRSAGPLSCFEFFVLSELASPPRTKKSPVGEFSPPGFSDSKVFLSGSSGHVGNRASAIPVRVETGLGDYTAETLRSRRSSYRDIILNKSSANSVLLCLKVFAACANYPVAIQTISVQKRIHRGDAEYAEKRILSNKTPNSATSVPLR